MGQVKPPARAALLLLRRRGLEPVPRTNQVMQIIALVLRFERI